MGGQQIWHMERPTVVLTEDPKLVPTTPAPGGRMPFPAFPGYSPDTYIHK